MIKYKKLKKFLIWKCHQKNVGSQLPTATRMAEPEDVEDIAEILLPCTSCGRTFRPEALAKHSKVCEKTFVKKRKTFDSFKQRLQGTDLEAYATVSPLVKNKKSDMKTSTSAMNITLTKSSPAKWRDKNKDPNGRTEQTPQVAATPVVKKTVKSAQLLTSAKPSDHQQCRYCERYFGPKAHSRHVEWCKDQQLKHKPVNMNTEARERLQVRTGYRAPLPNKVLTRDKYQRGGSRSRDSSLSKETSKPKVNEPVSRSHTFNMGKSPEKSVHPVNDRRTISQPKINIKSPKVVKKLTAETEKISSTPMKANVTLPKILPNNPSEKSEIEKYDPFASAEQQMLELFSNTTDHRQRETSNNNKNININRNNSNNLNNNNNNNDNTPASSNNQVTSSKTATTPVLKSPELITKTPPTKSPLFTSRTPTKSPIVPSPPVPTSTTPTESPHLTSAFAVYSRKTSSENLPLDIESNNNIIDNENINNTFYPLDHHLQEIESEFLLNNIESCSVVSIDSVIDGNKKYLRSISEQLPQKSNNLDSLASEVLTSGIVKSNSSSGTGRTSTKKVNLQQMLFGNSSPPPQHTNLVTSISSTDITPDVDNETLNLLEECEAELLLELEKMFNNPKKSSPVSPASSSHLPDIQHQSSYPVCSSTDDRPGSINDKESDDKKTVGHTIDSAYSSLTRVLSEGDSEKTEQARFCHECGTQYPIALAKFCCYCGMKRIAL